MKTHALRLVVLFLAVCVMAAGCGGRSYGKPSQDAEGVSLVALIANPDVYDGKHIRVVGIVHVGFECDALYFSSEDYKMGITKNAVYLELTQMPIDVPYDELKKLNGRYVVIEGVFDSKEKGHMGLYSGTISDISRIDTYS